jgi:hypothetical protein
MQDPRTHFLVLAQSANETPITKCEDRLAARGLRLASERVSRFAGCVPAPLLHSEAI